MNKKIWRMLVAIVFIITISSFLIFFKENKLQPVILSMPFIFWIGILQTMLLVVCTFLGAIFFPFNSDEPT